MNRFVMAVTALVLVAPAGCGDKKPAEDATKVPAISSTPAAEGETCGGAAVAPATPRTCGAGLTCDAMDPTFPGTCQKAK